MADATGRIHNRAKGLSTEDLRFPSDIGMSRKQHYIRFFINEQTGAIANFPSDNQAASGDVASGENTTITLPRSPTKRLAGSITLYMPNQLSVAHKANYGEPEVGFMTAAMQEAIKAMAGNSNMNTESLVRSLATQAKDAAQKALENVPGFDGARAATQMATGRAIVNRSEMMFEGIDRRSFQFSFRLLPSSAEEADAIERIVTAFRLHSMPTIEKQLGGRSMLIPSTFDIEYSPGIHLHRISTCVCESVDVKYGGDRTQFYTDGHPVQTELTLQFKELEIIDKTRVSQGF